MLEAMPNTSGLIQLIYASAATVKFEPKHLETLLHRARKKNTELDVSGVLLHKDGTFLQVLEGARDTVLQLYKTIEKDPRHENVLVLASREIDARNFGNWSMGFIRDPNQIAELPGFVGFLDKSGFVALHGDSQRIQTILEGFRRGRWHRISKAVPPNVVSATS